MASDFLSQLFGLDGKNAVVIGGDRDTGGVICEVLARAGAAVVVAGDSESRGHRRVETIRALAGDAGFMFVDAADRESLEALCDRAFDEHGVIDILVICCGEDARTDEDAAAALHAGEVFAPRFARQDDGGTVLVVSNPADSPTQRVSDELARVHGKSNVRFNTLEHGVGNDAARSLLFLVSPAGRAAAGKSIRL
jgi:short-subunit dehydrogenase